jgi:hypothetical protein
MHKQIPQPAAPPKLHINISPQHIAAATNRREMQERAGPEAHFPIGWI